MRRNELFAARGLSDDRSLLMAWRAMLLAFQKKQINGVSPKTPLI